ncbi:MAG TPA: heme biosynthesis HemY N-terminal domain-containing protein [Stellaceae bacterium]|jgi:HemY protein|nr:heme biosynthesis HemY N-terminal domain-containing protein [Stellaceae bacterium]
MRALPAIIVIALLIAGAIFVADRPGDVSLVWQGYRVYTSVAVLIFGVALIAVIAAALFHFLRLLVRSPRMIARGRRERRRRRGYRALSQGMVAVAAGDPAEAKRFARQADVLLAEPPLTLLLSAQAAQLNGDEKAAEKYFTAMLDRAETEFLGLRGLIMQALKRKDEAVALKLAERAKELRPKTQWVLASLFELQARAGKWAEAEATLGLAAKRKAIDAVESTRHRAVMLYEQSRVASAESRDRDAVRLAAKAHAMAPGFTQAAVRYAEMLSGAGQTRQARKVIETAWEKAPHPELAATYDAIFGDERPLQRLKRFETLAARAKDHVESHIALALAALKARLWGEARRHLAEAGGREDNAHPSPRVARLMAELEEAEHADLPAARLWLSRATTTATQDAAYVCAACGGEVAHWTSLCPHCRSFDSIEWRPPGRAPVPHLQAAREMMPALPVPGSTAMARPPRDGLGLTIEQTSEPL